MTHHTHPRPLIDQLTQYAALGFVLLAALLLIVQIALALNGQPPILLFFTSLTLVVLTAPALWLTAATPPVAISPSGLRVQPRVWRVRDIAWSDITAVKPYPLLPDRHGEGVRRAVEGRKKYRAAEGIMLIIPSLSWQYRFTGFFAGEGFTPVIALTNRTHADYATLIDDVRARTAAVWHD
jgi:hypothetical protein